MYRVSPITVLRTDDVSYLKFRIVVYPVHLALPQDEHATNTSVPHNATFTVNSTTFDWLVNYASSQTAHCHYIEHS